MDFFKSIGNAIAGFFKSDAFKFILNTGKSILKEVVGSVGPALGDVALQAVVKAQHNGGSADDKFKLAFDEIKSKLPGIEESAVNLAIELAVAAMKKGSAS